MSSIKVGDRIVVTEPKLHSASIESYLGLFGTVTHVGNLSAPWPVSVKMDKDGREGRFALSEIALVVPVGGYQVGETINVVGSIFNDWTFQGYDSHGNILASFPGNTGMYARFYPEVVKPC